MPILSDRGVRQVRVASSALFELMWVMTHVGFNHQIEGPHAELESVRRRFGPRASNFGADSAARLVELVVLAHRSGSLLGPDLHRFFAKVDSAISDETPLPSLRSESTEVVEATRLGLQHLRTDHAARKRYVSLLGDLWAAVEPMWEESGRPAVMATVQSWTRALRNGISYRQILGVQPLWPSRPEIDEFADESAANGQLILTPCWFGGPIHILELDGLTYLGAGIHRHGEPSYRDLAAAISSNLRAFADPTRVAILLRLAREPGSVSELARQFELSQPAVSGHVQILREAGLLDEKSVGRKAILRANEDRVLRILSDAGMSMQKIFGP